MLNASTRSCNVSLPSANNRRFFAIDASNVVVVGDRASPRVRATLPGAGALALPGIAKAAVLKKLRRNGSSRHVSFMGAAPETRSGRVGQPAVAAPPTAEVYQPLFPR